MGVENQPAVCFHTQIMPIVQANCAKSGCHAGRGETRLDLSTDAGVLRLVTPYQPSNSRLYTAISDSWGRIMPPPPSDPLPKEARSAIYLWILQGADTSCTK